MMNDLPRMIFDTVTQHIPQGAAWVPYAATGLVVVFGLILMLKGARLAPLMAACAFLGIGAVAASFAANSLATPVWPTIAIGGVIGFGIGLILFKIWLAILVAACFIGSSLTLYGVQVVSPYVRAYASQGYDAREAAVGVTLPAPGSVLAAAPTTPAELGQLWTYLVGNVPNFQRSILAIVASMGLAGILVGLLLPRASRAVFAATVGTFCVMVGLSAGLKELWPDALTWLIALGSKAWIPVGVIWLASLLHNYLDIRRKRPTKPIAEDAESAEVVAA